MGWESTEQFANMQEGSFMKWIAVFAVLMLCAPALAEDDAPGQAPKPADQAELRMLRSVVKKQSAELDTLGAQVKEQEAQMAALTKENDRIAALNSQIRAGSPVAVQSGRGPQMPQLRTGKEGSAKPEPKPAESSAVAGDKPSGGVLAPGAFAPSEGVFSESLRPIAESYEEIMRGIDDSIPMKDATPAGGFARLVGSTRTKLLTIQVLQAKGRVFEVDTIFTLGGDMADRLPDTLLQGILIERLCKGWKGFSQWGNANKDFVLDDASRRAVVTVGDKTVMMQGLRSEKLGLEMLFVNIFETPAGAFNKSPKAVLEPASPAPARSGSHPNPFADPKPEKP